MYKVHVLNHVYGHRYFSGVIPIIYMSSKDFQRYIKKPLRHTHDYTKFTHTQTHTNLVNCTRDGRNI